jgi:hypothetical protein
VPEQRPSVAARRGVGGPPTQKVANRQFSDMQEVARGAGRAVGGRLAATSNDP